MSKIPPPSSVSNGKNSNSNPIKIAKRDAQSLRLVSKLLLHCLIYDLFTYYYVLSWYISSWGKSWSSSLQKLAIGSLPEKIITALHSVNDEHPNEEAALNKCNDAVCQVGKLVEDVENTLSQGKRS